MSECPYSPRETRKGMLAFFKMDHKICELYNKENYNCTHRSECWVCGKFREMENENVQGCKA